MKHARTTLNLTEGRPIRVILLFAVPVFFGNLLQLLYGLVDTKIVGSILGETALAAVGSVSVLYTLLTGFFNGLSLGFGVVTARYHGSGDEKELKKIVAGSILLGFATAAAIILVTVCAIRPILALLNVPPQQMETALSYITLLIWGMYVTLAYNLCANMLRAIGDAVTPLIFLVISALTNVVLDYLFILELDMGVQGAAVATLLSQLLSLLLCLVRIWRGFPILHVAREDFCLTRERAWTLYESGLSMGLMSSLVNFGTLVLQSGINQLGTQIIVAHTAARKILEISVLPVSVLGSSMATYCSQNFGAGRSDRIRQGVKVSLLLGGAWDVVVILLAHLVSPFMIRSVASTAEPDIIYWGSTYLRVDMSFLPVCLFIVILRNAMQGFGDPRTPVFSSLIELAEKLVFTFVFVRMFGYWGIIWTEPVAWILMVIPLIVMTIKNPVFKDSVRSTSNTHGRGRFVKKF